MTSYDLHCAQVAAKANNVPYALVCAICEQESSWSTWAMRYEPAFFTRYVLPLGLKDATEANARATSFGLMQLMGQVARERGFTGRFLTELCDEAVGLDYGCKVIRAHLTVTKDDIATALLRYNGGANALYPQQVLARMPHYAV